MPTPVYSETKNGQSIALGATPVDSLLSSGLVALWRMEETVWDGTADEVVDSSGNGNHGTAAAAVTAAGGKLGRGGDF